MNQSIEEIAKAHGIEVIHIETIAAEGAPKNGYKCSVPRGFHLYSKDGHAATVLWGVDDENRVIAGEPKVTLTLTT